MGIGFWELLLIVLLIVVVFGSKKIPDIMGELGKGVRTFKESMEKDDDAPPAPEATTPPKPLPAAEPQKDQSTIASESKSETPPKTGPQA
jgi:sec-independent protein translocase protein TatA